MWFDWKLEGTEAQSHGSLELENAEALRAGNLEPIAVPSAKGPEIEGKSGSSEFVVLEVSRLDVFGSSRGERWKVQWSLRH